MITKLELFKDQFQKYQQRPIRGIFIDTHNEFVKVSPAAYTENTVDNDIVVPKREIFNAIVAAESEAKILKLNKGLLPLGADTHVIRLEPCKIGLTTSFKINLSLVLDNPKIELQAFKVLVEKYKINTFPLGRIPFHDNVMSNAMTQLAKSYKHARISSIFYRKRDQYPRIYVGIAMNDFIFGLRTSETIDISDYDDSYNNKAVPVNIKTEIDL